MKKFFKSDKNKALEIADNGEERLNINTSVFRKFADDRDVKIDDKPAEISSPALGAPTDIKTDTDQISVTPVIIIQKNDNKTNILLKLIDKALSLL